MTNSNGSLFSYSNNSSLSSCQTLYQLSILGIAMNTGLPFGYLVQNQGNLDPLITIPMFLGAWSWSIYYDTIYVH